MKQLNSLSVVNFGYLKSKQNIYEEIGFLTHLIYSFLKLPERPDRSGNTGFLMILCTTMLMCSVGSPM